MVEKLRETIGKQFLGKSQSLKLATKVDAGILGGLLIQIGDRTVDFSVASRLNTIKKDLANL